MKRGELYRVRHPTGDPKRTRVFVIVSRQAVIDSRFCTVICAPIYSDAEGLSTQVAIGLDEGLTHDSAILCDNLVSIRKDALTDYVGSLGPSHVAALREGLRIALDVD